MYQHFVKVASFLDFARYVCAFRENPLRVYQFKYNKKMVFSSRKVLSNSILHFFIDSPNDGRYISYNSQSGKEVGKVVDHASAIANYAPIVELDSIPFALKQSKRLKDKFHPIKVHELGDLARLTYDPEWPDDYEVTLFSFPNKKKWIVGYITQIDLDDIVYCFNYVELKQEPQHSFLKYSGHKGSKAEFTNKFQHGYPYLPIIKLKSNHPIFGIK